MTSQQFTQAGGTHEGDESGSRCARGGRRGARCLPRYVQDVGGGISEEKEIHVSANVLSSHFLGC